MNAITTKASKNFPSFLGVLRSKISRERVSEGNPESEFCEAKSPAKGFPKEIPKASFAKQNLPHRGYAKDNPRRQGFTK